MRKISVKSSNIKSIAYDKDKMLLEVEFHSGHTYQYIGVSEFKMALLAESKSPNAWLSDHIKGDSRIKYMRK